MRIAILLLSVIAIEHVEKQFPTYTDSNPGLIASNSDFLANRDEFRRRLPAKFHDCEFWQPTTQDVIRAEHAVKAAVDVGTKKPSLFYVDAPVTEGIEPKLILSTWQFELSRIQELYGRYFRQFVGLKDGSHRYIYCNFVQPEDLDLMSEEPEKAVVSSADPRPERLHFVVALVNIDTNTCEYARIVGRFTTPPGNFPRLRSTEFEGYAIPAEYADQNLFYLTGRENATFWNPSEAEMQEAYRGALPEIKKMISEMPRKFGPHEVPASSEGQQVSSQFLLWRHLNSIVAGFSKYRVQFLGVVRHGRRHIYCNFTEGDDPSLKNWMNPGRIPDPPSGTSITIQRRKRTPPMAIVVTHDVLLG